MAKPIKVGDVVNCSQAGYPNISIVSNDQDIASVDNEAKTVTAVSTGIVSIAIYDLNNNNRMIDQFSLIVKEDELTVGRLFGTGVEKNKKVERILRKLN